VTGVTEAGNIDINVGGKVNLAGVGKDGSPSAIASQLGLRREGKAGNINIKAGSFSLDGEKSVISSSTFGKGNAGNISITTDGAVNLTGGNIFSSVVNTGVGNAGKITINAKDLSLQNGAQLISSVEDLASNNSVTGITEAGNIEINVGGKVNLAGITEINSSLGEGREGKAGDINIKAGSFSLDGEKSRISSVTLGKGNAGNVNLTTDGSVNLTGGNIFSSVERTGVGNAGKITINAKDLSLQNGAQLISIVRDTASNNSATGTTEAGNIEINVGGAVNIAGVDNKGLPSAIFSSLGSGREGKAGDINIKAGSFSLDGEKSAISSSTFGKGNAGNIDLTTDGAVNLTGGEIFSVVAGIKFTGVGNAGKITINAKDLSLQNGAQLLSRVENLASNNSATGITEAGNIEINVGGKVNLVGVGKDGFASGISSELEQGREGKAGDITIKAGLLSLADGAFIDSSTFGIGKAGNIDITANSLTLDRSNIRAFNNPSTLDESSNSIPGSNITINFKDILRLNGDSYISAEANGNASGGNININADNGFIVAKPNLDNDIIATAQQGAGGKIDIDVERVYGFDKSRIQNISAIQQGEDLFGNDKNDINSSSGNPTTPGSVQINTEQIDPGKERVKNSGNVVEPDDTVAQACGVSETGELTNSFTIVGRGGMPEDPTKPLNSVAIAGNLKSGRDPMQKGGGAEERRSEGAEENKTLSSDEIIPARGVAYNEKGQVVLTRYPTKYGSDRPLPSSDYCSVSSRSEKSLATNIEDETTEETLDDRTVAELMDFLYSLNPNQKNPL
jgi:large exoprotein involved in heme utilization and adhesion